MAFRAQHLVQLAHHVHRQAHRARLVHDRALDALADPPGGVGRKTEAALGLELVDGVHQAEIAFLDQVEQRPRRDSYNPWRSHDQPQIVLDHCLARLEFARLASRE